jgi:hypothetical protein
MKCIIILFFVFNSCVVLHPVDPDFLLLYHQSLISLKHQTFTNWSLILIGDCLSSRQQRKVHEQIQKVNFPAERRVVFRNLMFNETQTYLYRKLKRKQQPMVSLLNKSFLILFTTFSLPYPLLLLILPAGLVSFWHNCI